MAEIEKHRKKPVEVEMMLWDGSQLSADQIVLWTSSLEPYQPGFMVDRDQGAMLWVAHDRSWSPLPVGYRVAKELDGSGFYPLSPEGFKAGYVDDAGALPDFDHPYGWTWRNDMPLASQIHVEPAFKPELGDVFIRIDQDGRHEGIWLSYDVMEQFIDALRRAGDAPMFDDDAPAVSE